MLLISKPARILRARSNRLSLLRVVPTRYSLLRLRMVARFPSLTTPRSKIHTLRAFPHFRSTVRSKHRRATVPLSPDMDMDVTDAQRCTSDVRKGRRESSALAKCHRAENQADSIELYNCACSSERDRLHGVDAIVVGYYRGEDLLYVARVRNGFVPASRRQVFTKLKLLLTPKCPFANLPEAYKGRWGEGLINR